MCEEDVQVRFIEPKVIETKIMELTMYVRSDSIQHTEEGVTMLKPRVQMMIDPHYHRIFEECPEMEGLFLAQIAKTVQEYESAPSEFDKKTEEVEE